MSIIDLISKKRDGGVYTSQEIKALIGYVCDSTTPDFQISALLMAIYLRGMNDMEVSQLTLAMAKSGEMLDFSDLPDIVVDKHSTGGVGDKTSLVLLPLVAAAGLKVAKLSGKGLGHTGGTLDKLSVFPGFRFDLNKDEIQMAVKNIGIAITGQSHALVPADKRMYELRDLTATVDALPLIASSIMSKKLAAGASIILLDVKVGSGAIFQDIGQARQLALAMVSIGQSLGIPTKAVLTDMNTPLGKAIGNALEVKEAIETLKGTGDNRLLHLSIELGARLLKQAVKHTSLDVAREQLRTLIDSGKALAKLKEMIKNQGGSCHYIDYPDQLPLAPMTKTIYTEQSGYIQEIHAKKMGECAMLAGAGRTSKDQALDLGSGVLLHCQPGDKVQVGDSLFTIYASDSIKLNLAFQQALGAIQIDITPPLLHPLILEEI